MKYMTGRDEIFLSLSSFLTKANKILASIGKTEIPLECTVRFFNCRKTSKEASFEVTRRGKPFFSFDDSISGNPYWEYYLYHVVGHEVAHAMAYFYSNGKEKEAHGILWKRMCLLLGVHSDPFGFLIQENHYYCLCRCGNILEASTKGFRLNKFGLCPACGRKIFKRYCRKTGKKDMIKTYRRIQKWRSI